MSAIKPVGTFDTVPSNYNLTDAFSHWQGNIVLPVDVAAKLVTPELLPLFKGEEGLTTTISSLRPLDQDYGPVTPKNGVFTPEMGSDFLYHQFRAIAINKWIVEDFRPSATGLAAGLLQNLDIDIHNFQEDQRLTSIEKALTRSILVASLYAETVKGEPGSENNLKRANSYHNGPHNLHVTSMTYCFTSAVGAMGEDKNEGRLSRALKLYAIFLALIHDAAHPGIGNPTDDRIFNERQSAAIAHQILFACGGDPLNDYIDFVEPILAATSPNGMIGALKKAVNYPEQREQIAIDFPEIARILKTTPAVLIKSTDALKITGALNDSDLSASAGFGNDVNKIISTLLTSEFRKENPDSTLDFSSPESRIGFYNGLLEGCFTLRESNQLLGLYLHGAIQETLNEIN